MKKFFSALIAAALVLSAGIMPVFAESDVSTVMERLEDIEIEFSEQRESINDGPWYTVYRMPVSTWNQLAFASLPTDEAGLREYLSETTNFNFSDPAVIDVAQKI